MNSASTMETSKPTRPSDRSRHARIRDPLAPLLEELAQRLGSTFAIEVNRAVANLLRQEGLWPPPPERP